jgi:hypothetical protein
MGVLQSTAYKTEVKKRIAVPYLKLTPIKAGTYEYHRPIRADSDPSRLS